MLVTNARILLQRRNPRHLHRRRQDALTQGRDPLHFREQQRRDCVNGLVTHRRLVKRKSSYWSSARASKTSFPSFGTKERKPQFSLIVRCPGYVCRATAPHGGLPRRSLGEGGSPCTSQVPLAFACLIFNSFLPFLPVPNSSVILSPLLPS